MTVDPKHHKHFVARRGKVLREIGEEFGGVVVSFPRAGVAGDVVNLKGARNCVDAAKARIQEIVKDLEEMVTIDCEIEQQYHRSDLLFFCIYPNFGYKRQNNWCLSLNSIIAVPFLIPNI